ncbi:uncharacterized protein LY89DRAFT_603343 [Mollisia scopiformis]|uniref:Uncharacterized protein n=1 Tax=Mollisia scopiformis TaxID=149040 RepID=A0A132B1V5_MOLSC|nr:uncharacterized protein LY89DRAFT_603343 [Mollisia scopiformis]KUJ06360.1 hypothetical protein LY89DRAFT_603343 [Mollisia scopiformis]
MQLNFLHLALLSLLSLAIANSPIILTPGRHGAAVEVDQQDVCVYFQDADSSKGIAPNFPAGSGYAGPGVILLAGVARNNTPIAAVVLQNNGTFGEIHVFYFGVAYTDRLLSERVWTAGVGWHDGPLSGLGYTSRAVDHFLYAFTDGKTVGSTIRVGFACDGLGPMCEAYCSPSAGWAWNVVQ